MVKLLLEEGADINSKNICDGTPLAFTLGNTEFRVKCCFRYEEDENVQTCDCSFSFDHNENIDATLSKVVESLIENGANFEPQDRDRALLDAAWRGFDDLVNLLIKKGANVNARDSIDYSPLLQAVIGGSRHSARATIVQSLIDNGAIFESGEKDKALVQAAFNGSVEIVKMMIKFGANVNAADKYHRSPLFAAVTSNRFEPEIVQSLTDSGAIWEPQDRDEALFKAAKAGSLDVIKILITNGADVNLRDKNQSTTILEAVKGSKPHRAQTVQYLMDHGAKLESQEWDEVLLEAAGRGCVEVVNIAIKNGANVNVRDKDQSTPLIEAIFHNGGDNTELVKILCSNGADVHLKDRWNESPMSRVKGNRILKKKSKEDIVQILKSYGAVENAQEDFEESDEEFGFF